MYPHPLRYTAVPWLSNAADLRPAGDPETTVELFGGTEITHGLRIAEPFGRASDAMLAIHAVRDTGVITLAITDLLALDVRPVRRWDPSMENRQSGGHRSPRSQADGYSDDEGDC